MIDFLPKPAQSPSLPDYTARLGKPFTTNPLPSCTVPETFAAFGRHGRQPEKTTSSATALPMEDFTSATSLGMPASKAIGLFLSGVALAYSSRWVGRGLFRKSPAKPTMAPAATETRQTATGSGFKPQTSIFENYMGTLSSVLRLALERPEDRKAMLGYLGASVIGYLAGNTVQGTQETWVRREETRIRSRLINKLQGAFQESINIKYQSDAALKQQAKARILDLLSKQGVPQAELLVADQAVVESLGVQQHYFYEPTHRTPAFGSENESPEARQQPKVSKCPVIKAVNASLVGAGVLTGLAMQGLTKLFTSPAQPLTAAAGEKSHIAGINLKDDVNWWLRGGGNKKILMAFLTVSAATRVGKMAIDGLREIEVTRRNAQTEYAYQSHNWLKLDPSFHNIAENAAFENDFKQLSAELPSLRQSPELLRQRIQAILTNVGRNSAPRYFPMIPQVGLVEARG